MHTAAKGGFGEMFQAHSATLPHRPCAPMPSVNGRVPASEAQREGWSEAEVCAEEVVNPQKPLRWRRWASVAAWKQKLIAFGVLDDNGLDGV